MEVQVREAMPNGAPYVVEIGGDIDIATVDDLERPVIHAIRDGRRPVILDLNECAFMDSTGIRLLIRAHHLLGENGNGRVRPQLAVIARAHVARLLQLTGVDKVIPVVSSRAEAEAAISAR